jgi:hypothetical protein
MGSFFQICFADPVSQNSRAPQSFDSPSLRFRSAKDAFSSPSPIHQNFALPPLPFSAPLNRQTGNIPPFPFFPQPAKTSPNHRSFSDYFASQDHRVVRISSLVSKTAK